MAHNEISYKMNEELESGWESGGRSRDREALRKAKALRKGKEYVRIPIPRGYAEIEKSKYERLKKEGRK